MMIAGLIILSVLIGGFSARMSRKWAVVVGAALFCGGLILESWTDVVTSQSPIETAVSAVETLVFPLSVIVLLPFLAGRFAWAFLSRRLR
jgi:hypothetical protein